MRIFISYRRTAWAFTRLLANGLRERIEGEVFVDTHPEHGIDRADFAKSILDNLRRSHAFVLVVTEETFAPERIQRKDDWIRREVREAFQLGTPVVLALYENCSPPASEDLPRDIQKLAGQQGIRFFQDYFDDGVERLWKFIKAVMETRRRDLIKALEELRSEDVMVRIRAAKRLRQLREESTVPTLSACLNEESDSEAIYSIVIALGMIGGDEAKETLEGYRSRLGNQIDDFIRMAIDEALALLEQYRVS
jgi:hypothetical protein